MSLFVIERNTDRFYTKLNELSNFFDDIHICINRTPFYQYLINFIYR